MSKNRNICVCGRERGKGPVVISITTCKHNNTTNCEGSVKVSVPPTATDRKSSTPARNTITDDRKNSRRSVASGTDDEEEKTPKDDRDDTVWLSKGGGEIIDNLDLSELNDELNYDSPTTLETSEDVEGTEEVTPFINPVEDEEKEPLVEKKVTHFVEDEAALELEKDEDAINEDQKEETVEQQAPTIDDEDAADEEPQQEETRKSVAAEQEPQNEEPQTKTDDEPNEEEDDADENTNEVPIMMLREIAVNTVPFLQNLFRFRPLDGKKSMPSFDEERKKDENSDDDNNNCTVEVFIFEKHGKDCRRIKKFKILNENSFHDGDSWVESIGRISFPTCTDEFQSNESSKINLSASDSEKNLNHHKRILKMLEAYLRNKRYYDAMNNKGPFDLKLQKYITMDSKESSKSIVYLSEVKHDKSVQFSGVHTDARKRDAIRSRKWYEGFLICFGIKNPKDVHDVEDFDRQLGRESSNLMTRYLRI